MQPRRVSLRAAQDPWDIEEQWEYNGEYDGEYDEDYDGEYDGGWDSNGDATDSGWEPADPEEVSALATEGPEIEEPAPVLAEKAPGNPSTSVADKSRINKRGLVGDFGRKVVGKVADVVADKVAEKLAGKKQEEKEKEKEDEALVSTVAEHSSGFTDHTFMDNLVKAIKGPNVPVMDGLPGITSYDEEAPSNPEDPRRIHRILKVVLGRELFEELRDLSLDTYETQDHATREKLVKKVLSAVKGNPATEKIKLELLEGLPGLGNCGINLPLRMPVAKPIHPCELAELCAPESYCPVADLCRKANAQEADDDVTLARTITNVGSDDAGTKVSPMLTLLRLFRAAKAFPGVPGEPNRKFHKGSTGFRKHDVGDFEAYMADFNNACSFNMREIRKEVVGVPRKLNPKFKTVEHTITVAGATRKPQGDDENKEGAKDGENENEHEDLQKSKNSPANEIDNNAEAAINDSEATPASDRSTSRYGDHYRWLPSSTYPRRWVVPSQDEIPVVAGAPAVPAANVAPNEAAAPSTLSEAGVDDLIAETIAVASLGPALPPSTTPESTFDTSQFSATGIVGESTPGITDDTSSTTDDLITETVTVASLGPALPPPSTNLNPDERKSKPAHAMSKEASSWNRKQRQRARRIKKQREARARALRRIRFAKKLQAERARKAADRAAFLEEVDYEPPTLSQHSKRAPSSPLQAHAPARTGQGVKEEEQRWYAGEGQVSAADREEAAREIAKVAKLREAERENGGKGAAAVRVAVQDYGIGNPYLDHKSYDPAQAHVVEAAGFRFPTYKSVGDAAPELGNVGVGLMILVWIALMVAVLRCQRRRVSREDGSPNWAGEGGGRGRKFLRQGRNKRQSEEKGREKLDV